MYNQLLTELATASEFRHYFIFGAVTGNATLARDPDYPTGGTVPKFTVAHPPYPFSLFYSSQWMDDGQPCSVMLYSTKNR